MIGRTLKQYTITARLGTGGMGEVWLARDTMLDRDVALKILPAGDGDAANRKERFFREARAASALNHPNIVTIYEINADQDVDFIAMEYVNGATLATRLQQGRLPLEVVRRVATEIAESVGRAHRAGIVHRDLKPGNIMLTDDGRVKVLDFGIAKIVTVGSTGADDPTKMTLTRAGVTIGTVGYMSPEQAIGDPVDARSDVFSFGVILFEMLAGQRPFTGKTLSEALRELHLADPPPLTALRPDTPPLLRDVVARALEKKPEARFSNLGEVAVVLAGGPSPTAATIETSSPLRPARAGAPRARSLLAMAAAGTVVVVIGTTAWRAVDRGVTSAPTSPTAAPGDAPFDAASALADASALLTRQDREGNVDRAIALLERVIAADAKSAIGYAHLSTAYWRKQQTNPDPRWLNLARENADRALRLNADLAAAWNARGFAELAARDFTAAADAFTRSAEMDPRNPTPQLGLAMISKVQNHVDEAEARFRRALDIGAQDWRVASEYAEFNYQLARYAEAARLWEQSLKLIPDNVITLRNLGAVYFMLDRPDEAASSLQRALEIRPMAPIYTNLGTIRFFQGRYTDAVAAFEKGVELGANNHLNWGNLGDGLRWAPGRRGDAPAAYRRAIELIREALVAKPGDSGLETRLALYQSKMGDAPAARKAADALNPRKDLTAQMLYRLTVVYELAGDRDRSLALLKRALEAGYPAKEAATDPELTSLRTDTRYHRLVDAVGAKR